MVKIMTKEYEYSLKVITILIFALISTPAFPGASAEGEATAAKSVAQGLAPAMNALNTEALTSVVAENAMAIAAGISNEALSSCISGSGCESVFRAIMKNLNKLLTPEFRMTNAIHLLRPDKVQFSKGLTQKLSSILMKAK